MADEETPVAPEETPAAPEETPVVEEETPAAPVEEPTEEPVAETKKSSKKSQPEPEESARGGVQFNEVASGQQEVVNQIPTIAYLPNNTTLGISKRSKR